MEIHKNAYANFVKCADELLPHVGPVIDESPKQQYRPEYVGLTIHVNSEEEKELRFGQTDYFGRKFSFKFRHENSWWGLSGDPYESLKQLAAGIYKIKEVSTQTSHRTIVELLEKWVQLRFTGEVSDNFVDHLLKYADKEIRPREILVPISGLSTESAFRIGTVEIVSLNSAFMDWWKSALLKGRDNPELADHFERRIRPYQGFSAAKTRVTADARKSNEVAFVRIRQTLAVLRVFSPHAAHPLDYSPIAMWGDSPHHSWSCYMFEENVLVTESERIIGFVTQPMVYDNTVLHMMLNGGMNEVHKYLSGEIKSEYFEKLFDAIMMFSEGTTKRTVADKLIYLTVALESLFIRNESEPIQKNLGERIAFLVADESARRREIVKLTSDAYALRSSYVHHGKHPKELETLTEFFNLAWLLFLKLCMNTEQFASIDLLLDWIETKKFS